jgi:hypothetical protein
MTTITSNGSKWAGEPPDTLETLLEVLTREPLDPMFAAYGDFVIDLSREQPDQPPGTLRFWGNFYALSHVFSIDTNEPPIIDQLTTAIRANQQTPAYATAKQEHAEHARKAAAIQAARDARRRADIKRFGYSTY